MFRSTHSIVSSVLFIHWLVARRSPTVEMPVWHEAKTIAGPVLPRMGAEMTMTSAAAVGRCAFLATEAAVGFLLVLQVSQVLALVGAERQPLRSE